MRVRKTEGQKERIALELDVKRGKSIPIYLQIRNQIREMIFSGVLPEGYRLPPERRLSEELGVNRTTVLNAYRELKAEGLIDSHVGRGTVVKRMDGSICPLHPATKAPLHWERYLRYAGEETHESFLRQVSDAQHREGFVSLSCGEADAKLYPLEAIREIQDRLFRERGQDILRLTCIEGLKPLREAICSFQEGRGIAATPDEVLVFSGSQQALDVVSRAFVEPGDLVVVEDPTYVNCKRQLRFLGARVAGVPLDEEGMRLDVLEGILKRRAPKFIYTIPTFQNPTGHVMSVDRRRRLLDLAGRYQVPIVEDDPFYDLRYEGTPIPTLKALDENDYVIYISTFSKSLSPGLRVGWITAPRPIVRRLAQVKKISDLSTCSLSQWIVDGFLRGGFYRGHLQTIRQEYASRRDAMVETLQQGGRHGGLEWNTPNGGYFVWVRFPREVNAAALLAKSIEKGVAYSPGELFSVEERGHGCARLNFSASSREEIVTGVGHFLRAFRECYRGCQAVVKQEIEELRPIV